MVTQVNFGDVVFNVDEAAICAVNVPKLGEGVCTGTAYVVDILQGTEVNPVSTALAPLEDSKGVVALATVLTHAECTISMAGTQFTSMQIAGGYQIGYSSANQYDIYPEAGGGGLPWFACIMSGATADGASQMIGLPLMKLDNLPQVGMALRDWTMSEIGAKSIANRRSGMFQKAPYVMRPNLNNQVIQLTSTFFNAFFDVTA